jgi:uncharacterized protein (TIGR02996 family)
MKDRDIRNLNDVLRYTASEGDVSNLLRQIADNPDHHVPKATLRLVTADALDEQGRHAEAKDLRSDHPLTGYAHHNGQNLYTVRNGLAYPIGTPDEVVSALDNARRNGTRIRIHYGHTEGDQAGSDWLEEHEVEGTVGRTAGRIPVPLLVNRSNSTGGGTIGSNRIVKIRTASGNKTLYQHPQYNVGEASVQVNPEGKPAVWVTVNGQPHAGFNTVDQAHRWIKKMGLPFKPANNTPPPE